MTALLVLLATKARKVTLEKLGHRVRQDPQAPQVFLDSQQTLAQLVPQV